MLTSLNAATDQTQRGFAENLLAIFSGKTLHALDHLHRVLFAHIERRVGTDAHAIGADQIDQITQCAFIVRQRVVIKAA